MYEIENLSFNMFCSFKFIIIIAICIVVSITSTNSNNNEVKNEPYPWKDKTKCYYQVLEKKLNYTLSANCSTNLRIIKDSTIELPSRSDFINVASMPVENNLLKWWKKLKKPMQLRVDPALCTAAVNSRKKSIFNSTSCQLMGYMDESAPRCQTKYLQYICNNSQIPINSSRGNAFILPESDHENTFLPPQPFLLMARDSFVSMCGEIANR